MLNARPWWLPSNLGSGQGDQRLQQRWGITPGHAAHKLCDAPARFGAATGSKSWFQGHCLYRHCRRPLAGMRLACPPHGAPGFASICPLCLWLVGNSCHLTSSRISPGLGRAQQVVLRDEIALDASAQTQIFCLPPHLKAPLSLYPESHCAGEKCDQSILETTKNDLQ